MNRSIISLSLLTVAVTVSFEASNCAPVNRVTGIKGPEKDARHKRSNAGEGSAGQSDRNGIAFLNAVQCFSRLIDQKALPLCDPSLDSWNRSKSQATSLGKERMIAGRNRRKRQSGQKIKLPQALELVEEYGLKECVARTACELACNPNLYGRMGRALYRFMATVYNRSKIPGIADAAVQFYRSSITAGARLKGQNCRPQCRSEYTGCFRQTSSLLRMASHVDLSI